MPFEARALRVQLPCKAVTIIQEEEDDGVQLEVHRYWDVMTVALGGIEFDAGRCEECSGNPSEPLCNNASEDMNILARLDHRVLPILRRQLEARLREIEQAEEAVAEATRHR